MSDEDFVDETVASEEDAAEAFDPRSEAERQRDEYRDALQHLQADFENYRKRVARSSEDAAARATGDIVVKLLPVLDAFDYAEAHFENADAPEAQAIEQTRGVLLETLKKEGLERIDEAFIVFDPTVHDAVLHVEADDGTTGQVVDDVLRAGYKWKGAVLRPAMVRVKG